MYCCVLLCFAFLSLRLLILCQGNKSEQVLDGQYSRKLDVVSHSGFIYDKDLNLLSHEKKQSVLLAVPANISANYDELSEQISKTAINTDQSMIFSLLSQKTPFVLLCEPNNDLTALSGKEGIYVYDEYQESSDVARHLIGYKNRDGQGVSGLEKLYSDVLDQFDYKLYVNFEADASGKFMPDGRFTLFSDGQNENSGLVATLDKDIQEFCDGLEGNYIQSGAVLVTDVNTGEIIAMSSYPTYDKENVAAYLESDKGELLNRTLCTFTPGSVFKLVVAAAALEQNSKLFDFEYECTGKTEVEGNIFHCHDKKGHGKQNLAQAFSNSCNTYFIELGSKIGLECIVQMCQKLGLGQTSNIDGLESYKATIPEKDNQSQSYLANISFGQGNLLVSPCDMAKVVGVCSTGFLNDLCVIKGTYDGKDIKEFERKEKTRVLNNDTVTKLLYMMEMCVKEGTGKKAMLETVNTAGKTATAQTGSYYNDGTEKLHTWFCGIMGVNSPKYCIIVLCDGNSRNNKVPAEIFKIISEKLTNSLR